MSDISSTTPEIRPESTYRFVSVSTLEKRIRRHLAKQGQTLIHTKRGTAARQELGEYAVYDSSLGGIVVKDSDLSTLARELGVIDEHEVIDMGHMGWTWAVCRQSVVFDGDKRTLRHDPITGAYTTPEAAHRAAAKIGGDDVAVVGYFAGEDRA